MANLFISYTRQSEAIARTLANDIEALGNTVWFDQDLSGGQAWWDQILATVRNCDVFVFVLDPEALNSTACKREFGYAADLGKPILPVLVSGGVSTNLLPPALSKIQFVDYRKQDHDAAIRLARALTTIPPPKPLPEPLPASPEAPISYLGSLAEQIETTSTLSFEKQSALVVDLKRSLRAPETADDARTLLESLRNRRDLFANIAEEVDEVLGSSRKAPVAPFIGHTLLESRAGKWVRGQGLRTVGIVLPIIAMIALGTWAVQADLITKHNILRAQSMLMSIHVEPVMLTIDAGTFQQGDIHGVGDSDERPVRDVTMSTFRIGQTEVTYEEYDRFVIATGREFPGDEGWGGGRRPVINVSWDDATEYAKWLSQETGKRYRLPTESEWEYAARSGGKEERWAGTSDEEQLAEFAWYNKNSDRKTQEVGGKKANGLGLHDMSGNVWEWVEDCWHENYNGAPEDGSTWLDAGGGDCSLRVVRGGSWYDGPVHLRSSGRLGGPADFRNGGVGFRLAQDTP